MYVQDGLVQQLARQAGPGNAPKTTFAVTLGLGEATTDVAAIEGLKTMMADLEITACVFGREVGAGGHRHLQGMFTLKTSSRFAAVLAKLRHGWPSDRQVHLEVCADKVAMERYCRKDGDVVYESNFRKQGERTDLKSVVAGVKSGKNIRELATANPLEFIKYHHGIKALMAATCVPFSRDRVEFFWFNGVSGAGKTVAANTYETLIDGVYFPPFRPLRNATGPGLWWDGYSGEDTVLLDDFEGASWCDARTLVAIHDAKTRSVPIKGGTVVPRWIRVIVTSNYAPFDLVGLTSGGNVRGWTHGDVEVIARRITDFPGGHFTQAPYPAKAAIPVGGAGELVGPRLRSPPSSQDSA